MRINLSWWLISITALSIAACTPVQDDNYGSGYVLVHEAFWGANHDTPYPFTVSGEIVCGVHPYYGSAIYFNPVEFTDESYIGTPLNEAAAKFLKQAGMTPNVPYSIKKGADLSEAIEIGLRLCDQQRDKNEKEL